MRKEDLDPSTFGNEMNWDHWPIVTFKIHSHYMRTEQFKAMVMNLWRCYDRAYRERCRFIPIIDMRDCVYVKPEFISIFANWLLGMRQLTMYLIHSSVTITSDPIFEFLVNNIVMKIAKQVRPNFVTGSKEKALLWIAIMLTTEFNTIKLSNGEVIKG